MPEQEVVVAQTHIPNVAQTRPKKKVKHIDKFNEELCEYVSNHFSQLIVEIYANSVTKHITLVKSARLMDFSKNMIRMEGWIRTATPYGEGFNGEPYRECILVPLLDINVRAPLDLVEALADLVEFACEQRRERPPATKLDELRRCVEVIFREYADPPPEEEEEEEEKGEPASRSVPDKAEGEADWPGVSLMVADLLVWLTVGWWMDRSYLTSLLVPRLFICLIHAAAVYLTPSLQPVGMDWCLCGLVCGCAGLASLYVALQSGSDRKLAKQA